MTKAKSISFPPYKIWYFQSAIDKVNKLYSTLIKKDDDNRVVDSLKISEELLSHPQDCEKILRSELEYHFS